MSDIFNVLFEYAAHSSDNTDQNTSFASACTHNFHIHLDNNAEESCNLSTYCIDQYTKKIIENYLYFLDFIQEHFEFIFLLFMNQLRSNLF